MARSLNAPSSEPIRAHLQRLDKRALIELILAHADEAFRDHLRLQAARQAPKGPDLVRLRNHLESTFDDMDCRDGWDYRETHSHAARLEDFAETLQRLMSDGHAEAALDLATEALEGVESHYGNVDDSDGHLGDAAGSLMQVHHLACSQAGTDPKALAQWVFRMEMQSDHGVFDGLIEDYQSLLGERGLAHYRKLAEEVWDRIPPLKPGQGKGHDSDRWRITSLMKALTKDDPEARLEILLRDLSFPYHFLEVAEHCLKAGWNDRAITWAEQGLKSFKEADPRLRSFLADRYLTEDRISEAVALRWENFKERPDLETYQSLLAAALRGKDATTTREQALDHVRERFKAQQTQKSLYLRPDLDLLTRMHLLEKAPVVALATAREGGCRHETWMTLVDRLEKGHPAESLLILQEQLDTIISPMNDEAYRKATATLSRIRSLAGSLGRPGAFTTTLAQVITTHGRKRNLMARIKKAGLN